MGDSREDREEKGRGISRTRSGRVRNEEGDLWVKKLIE